MKRIRIAIEGIVAAALATAACGETAASSSFFASDAGTTSDASVPLYPDQADFACTTLPAILEDLTPAEPVDYLEVRGEVLQYVDGGFQAVPNADGGGVLGYTEFSSGSACATATDRPRCLSALAAVAIDGREGWSEPGGGIESSPRRWFAVYTRGDEVGTLTSPAQVAAFLGTIDTIGDARLMALAAARLTLSCEKPDGHGVSLPDPGWRHNADGSYELIAVVAECGPDATIERYTVSAGGAVQLVDTSSVDINNGTVCGRRPAGLVGQSARNADLGAYFAEVAWLEAAAVVAFRQVESDLRALGAPTALVDAARRARTDEIRHAREASALARLFGAGERPVDVTPVAARDRFAFALENAVEGCVRETYGAVTAAYQARTALDPKVRRFFASIAADEARHAELAHEIAEWVERDLDENERAVIATAKQAAFEELIASTETEVPFAGAVGLPSPHVARTLLAGLDREVLAA